MGEISMDQIAKELAKMCGMKMTRKGGKIVFADEIGAECVATTSIDAAKILYDEIFADGENEGKKKAVGEICTHARLL